jgi:alkanesulfonate monooxygenase SsuD/methylene tetrahydromethanopterin reductase-like flavin-dependent oxidoreductase (luciferase family)
VRYGLALPTGGECGDPRFLLELVERAEAAGWEGVFPEDYVLYQGDRAAPTTPTWPVLAAAAVRTKAVVLGVEVTPLTRRRPWNVAREVAAVDQLSEGRAVLGVGLGDVGDHVAADAS